MLIGPRAKNGFPALPRLSLYSHHLMKCVSSKSRADDGKMGIRRRPRPLFQPNGALSGREEGGGGGKYFGEVENRWKKKHKKQTGSCTSKSLQNRFKNRAMRGIKRRGPRGWKSRHQFPMVPNWIGAAFGSKVSWQ